METCAGPTALGRRFAHGAGAFAPRPGCVRAGPAAVSPSRLPRRPVGGREGLRDRLSRPTMGFGVIFDHGLSLGLRSSAYPGDRSFGHLPRVFGKDGGL